VHEGDFVHNRITKLKQLKIKDSNRRLLMDLNVLGNKEQRNKKQDFEKVDES